jgi:hypothetical protein
LHKIGFGKESNLDLFYIAAVFEKAGHEVAIVEANQDNR